MSEETARIIVYAIAGLGTVIWLVALFMAKRAFASPVRLDAGPAVPQQERQEKNELETANTQHTWVEGTIDQLMPKLVRQVTTSASADGMILERTTDTLVFEVNSPAGSNQLSRFRALVRFHQVQPNQCEMVYTLENQSPAYLPIVAGLFLVLGATAIIVTVGAMEAWVIPNPNMGVRGQVFQTFQIVHLIWPPFLFITIKNQFKKNSERCLQKIVNNLRFVD